MIKANQLIQTLKKKKINFFTGVPDSILKNFTNSIPKNTKHIIAANEGSAIALATGYHLSNNKLACVYLQNSGLGNAINPLVSIAHSKVYSIPMLLIIGWRGAPGQDDEPQHVEKGDAQWCEFLLHHGGQPGLYFADIVRQTRSYG